MKGVSRLEKGIFAAILIIAFVPMEMRVEVPSPIIAPIAPPPPKHEVVPVRPTHEAVWAEGHWRWDQLRRSFVWNEGRWLPVPPGYTWLPHQWKKKNAGWVFIEGMLKKAP